MRTLHTTFNDCAEIEFEVRASVYPGLPAKTYGRPEDCYPEEPDEVGEVHIFFDGEEVTGKLGDYLASQVSDETIITSAFEADDDDRAEAAYDKYEDRKLDEAVGL